MPGKACRGGPESKISSFPPFLGERKVSTGSVGRNGAGEGMTGCGLRRKRRGKGRRRIDICSGRRRTEKGIGEWKRGTGWLTADLRQGPQLAHQSTAEQQAPSSLQHPPCNEVPPTLVRSQERQARRPFPGTPLPTPAATPEAQTVRGKCMFPFTSLQRVLCTAK